MLQQCVKQRHIKKRPVHRHDDSIDSNITRLEIAYLWCIHDGYMIHRLRHVHRLKLSCIDDNDTWYSTRHVKKPCCAGEEGKGSGWTVHTGHRMSGSTEPTKWGTAAVSHHMKGLENGPPHLLPDLHASAEQGQVSSFNELSNSSPHRTVRPGSRRSPRLAAQHSPLCRAAAAVSASCSLSQSHRW